MITDKHFIDWETHVFGLGYGTGELPVMKVLKVFLELCHRREDDQPDGYAAYDYRRLEEELTPAVAWLLINALGNDDIIDYGTSPRFGWLSPNGMLLKEYVASKTAEELAAIVTDLPDDYLHCFKDHCNCDCPCNNPLFRANV